MKNVGTSIQFNDWNVFASIICAYITYNIVILSKKIPTIIFKYLYTFYSKYFFWFVPMSVRHRTHVVRGRRFFFKIFLVTRVFYCSRASHRRKTSSLLYSSAMMRWNTLVYIKHIIINVKGAEVNCICAYTYIDVYFLNYILCHFPPLNMQMDIYFDSLYILL